MGGRGRATRDRAATGATAALLVGSLAVAATVGTAANAEGALVGLVDPVVVSAVLLTVVLVAVAWWWSLIDERPRVARGIGLAAAGALLPTWALVPSLPGVLRAVLLAATPLVVAGVATVAAGWSDTPLSRWVAGLAGTAVLVHAVGYSPFQDPGCTLVCTQVPTLAGSVLTNQTVVAATSGLSAVAAFVAAVTVLRGPGAPWEVRVTSLAALSLAAAGALHRWATWGDPTSPAVVLLPTMLGTVLLAGGILTVAASTRRTRRAVQILADTLADPARPLSALPAPIVGVQVAMPEQDRWVDIDGRDVVDPPGTRCVGVGTQVRVVLGPGATAPDVVGRLGQAHVLALSNARVAAVTRAHQRDVEESQRRIVTLSDAERVRIERDLHDGAQQRLVSAKLHLRLAHSAASPQARRQLDRAEEHVQRAIERLRDLAHGAFPRLLHTEGLAVALADLAATAAVPVRLDVRTAHEPPQVVAMAVYAAVHTVVRQVGRCEAGVPIGVRVTCNGVRLDASISVPQRSPASARPDLGEVEDRVGALGGSLTTRDEPDGWAVTMEVPCVS